jgi:hypothetical protein
MIRNQIRYGGSESKFYAIKGNKMYITFSILCLIHQLLQCDQQMHTLLQNYDNVLICKLLVSGLTGSSSGTEQLYKIIVQPFCHPQYVELLHVGHCMSTEVGMCTVTGTARKYECLQSTHWNLHAVPAPDLRSPRTTPLDTTRTSTTFYGLLLNWASFRRH